ncbi:MAG TPA: M50 family metallopeptidase, partial [Bryobacteraceae bacterium]
MVGHLSKALRLFFGIQALLFAAISLRFAWSLPRLLSLEKTNPLTGHIMGFWSPSVWLATGLALTLTLTFIFAMTTWRLARANPSARHWAIAASVLSIPIFLVGPPAQFSAGAGIVGLIIFCRRSTAAQAIVRTPKHPRLPGDGTSPLTEWIAAAAMFVGVTFAGTLWSNWAAKTGLHSSQSTLMRLLLVQFAAVLTTVIHEAGHALAAAILDMKIRHLILGPFEWRQKSGRWRFRFRPLGAFTLPGAVGAVPASLENLRWRFVLFAAAGPMASLLLGIVAAWATVSAKSMPWEPCWRLLSYIATFSLIAFVLNLVPIAQEGQYSDGARIYQLLSKTGWAGVYQAFAIVGSTLVTPLRPR